MSLPLVSNRLDSKIAIVTGSSSGLGRAIALAFAANGAKLVVCADIRPDARSVWPADDVGIHTHDAINQRYGEGKGVYIQTDVTKAEPVERVVQEAVKLGGRLDVIVNNAGIGGTETAGRCHEMKEETWDITLNLNAKSVFFGCKYAIAQFLTQEPHSSGHRGWIINTASMLGLVGLKPNAAAYCASKGACVLLTKQLAVEYAAERIHANCLCPGYLKTPMTEAIYKDDELRTGINGLTPWGDWGVVEDVARCAVFFASEDANYVTGVPLAIDGGYTAQ
ncbi:MAG: hypothetical protein Q9191_004850 [Dirinaria sp. TL-2023a]